MEVTKLWLIYGYVNGLLLHLVVDLLLSVEEKQGFYTPEHFGKLYCSCLSMQAV